MKLTDMKLLSGVYGKPNGDMKNPIIIDFDQMPKFIKDYKPLVKISKIHTFCSKVNNRGRVRGLKFEYFDGDRSASTNVLGISGNSDSDIGTSWDDESNTVKMNEFISSVEVSSGDDVDGIWFVVQNWKDSTTRRIGCGYSTANTKTWNIKSDNRLLGFSGTSVEMDDSRIIKQIQFESFLYIVPTMTANGPECQCYTPNEGTFGKNGAKCTDGDFLWCGQDEYCTNGSSFPKDQFSAQCSTQRPFFKSAATPTTTLQGTHSVSAHHEKLLQQIAYKKSLHKSSAAGSGKGKPSVSAAPPKAEKDSAHHHTKWDDAKHSIKNVVKEMSKNLKQDLKAELKDLLVKELKEALDHLQKKQTHLESTVTRMLMHEVESY